MEEILERKEAVKEQLGDKAVRLQGMMMTQAEKARDVFDVANHKTVAFVQEHPAAALAGAVMMGYMVGRLLSRWR